MKGSSGRSPFWITIVLLLITPILLTCGGKSSGTNETIEPQEFPNPLMEGALTIIFLHHSTGANLIEQGGVRQRLADMGYAFYDHGYNADGLILPDGSSAGYNFAVPDDNTDPDGLAQIFRQPVHSPPDNTLSYLLKYDVIVFKSCFPVSNIGSDEQLDEYKGYYLSMRDRMDEYPNKLFIVVTQPPQVPANTDPAEAARARALARWLASEEYLEGRKNVFTFDFFDLLADPADHMLRPEYRAAEEDAHPNERANKEIAPLFCEFIDQSIRSFGESAIPQ